MKALRVILVILVLILVAEVGFLVYAGVGKELFAVNPTTEATEAPTTEPAVTEDISVQLPPAVTMNPTTEAPTEETTAPTTEAPTEVPTTAAPTEIPTEAPTEAPTEVPTEEATEATEAPTTEPTEEIANNDSQVFMLTFAGNCVLGGAPNDTSSASFLNVVGDDYGYPFRNVETYFMNDEFTFLDLECVLADSGNPTQSGHVFRGPTAYAKILSTGGVEAVSLANDHTDDFGKEGYDSTKSALEAENIAYSEKDSYLVYTTKNGLKIGIFTVSVKYDRWAFQQAVNKMKQEGADLIICYFHWGEEVSYAANTRQINNAHSAIDNGADIVIGTNPQVLQGVEYYKNGMICYSIGNFSYGGNKWPTDTDTVIIQQEVIRDMFGNVSLGDSYFIPCSMTSATSGNNFQPTPMELDTWQYNSVIKKLTEPIWKIQETPVAPAN